MFLEQFCYLRANFMTIHDGGNASILQEITESFDIYG